MRLIFVFHFKCTTGRVCCIVCLVTTTTGGLALRMSGHEFSFPFISADLHDVMQPWVFVFPVGR